MQEKSREHGLPKPGKSPEHGLPKLLRSYGHKQIGIEKGVSLESQSWLILNHPKSDESPAALVKNVRKPMVWDLDVWFYPNEKMRWSLAPPLTNRLGPKSWSITGWFGGTPPSQPVPHLGTWPQQAGKWMLQLQPWHACVVSRSRPYLLAAGQSEGRIPCRWKICDGFYWFHWKDSICSIVLYKSIQTVLENILYIKMEHISP